MNMLRIAAALCLVLSSSVAAAGVGQPPDGFVRLYGELGDVPCRPGRPIVLVFFTTACPTCWDDLFEVRSFIEERDSSSSSSASPGIPSPPSGLSSGNTASPGPLSGTPESGCSGPMPSRPSRSRL